MDAQRTLSGAGGEPQEAPEAKGAKNARAAGGDRWYVVQTIRGREQFAKENLERQKVPTYLPLFSRPVMRRNTVADQVSAFFPGYLFVSLPHRSSLWRSVGGTYGVSRIVRFGETPSPVPEGLVEYLKARTGADGALGFEDDLKPGDSVRLVGGAFDRIYGRLCSIEPAERVVVLLRLMGREVPVTVPRQTVMACND